MSICASLDAQNYVQANATAPESCTDYILLDSASWQAFQPVHWTTEEVNDFIAVTFLVWGMAFIFRLVKQFLLNK